MNKQKPRPDEIEGSEAPSKTAIKKEMQSLTDLGRELCLMSFEKVKKAPISEALLEAVAQYQKCRGFGAQKRHIHYVGKLMRSEEAEEIRLWLSGETVDQKLQTLNMHAAEQWRDRLIETPGALADFIEAYPEAAQAGLNPIIRQAALERQNRKPPKNYRQLYKKLYALIAGQNEPDPTHSDVEDEVDEL